MDRSSLLIFLGGRVERVPFPLVGRLASPSSVRKRRRSMFRLIEPRPCALRDMLSARGDAAIRRRPAKLVPRVYRHRQVSADRFRKRQPKEAPVTHLVAYRLRDPDDHAKVYGDDIEDEEAAFGRAQQLAD